MRCRPSPLDPSPHGPRPRSAGLWLVSLLAFVMSGCALVPRTDLPMQDAVPKTEPLPIDGIWRIEELGKRYRVEGGRVWLMDRLVVGPVYMQPGQVATIDVQQVGPNEYTGTDIASGSVPWKATTSPAGAILEVAAAIPARYTFVPVELDDRDWFEAQVAADSIIARPARSGSAFAASGGAGGATSASPLAMTLGNPALSASQRASFGRYHALVIGNNGYRHLPKLVTAARDADAVSRLLREQYGFEVTTLEDATRAEILTALRRLREQLTEGDNLLIYYAGHGWLDADADEGYWLPVDAESDSDVHWISNATITGYLRSIQAKHVMIVADSCYSGTLTRGIKLDVKPPDYLERIARQRARVVLSSGGLEPVADGGGGGEHSAFARHFLDELQANEGVLDSTTLYSRIRRPVMLAADQAPELADIRKAGHEGGDFLFIRSSAP